MKYWLLLFLGWFMIAEFSAETVFTGYPYGGVTVDTGLLGGAFALWKHTNPADDSVQTFTSVQVLAGFAYTQKNQFTVNVIPDFVSGKWRTDVSMVLKKWPDTFYGIGNDSDLDDAEKYTENVYGLSYTLRRQMHHSLFLSLHGDAYYCSIRDIKPGGMIDQATFTGVGDGMVSGSGLSIRWNTAGFGYAPRQGIDLTVKYAIYRSWLGSDYSFDHYRINCRGFIPISAKSVLALRTDLTVNHDDVPLLFFPGLGSRLRAYPDRRFVDKTRVSLNVEQRVFPFEEPLLDRIGFVFFTEFGQVSASPTKIRIGDWRWSAGFGLRFAILPAEHFNVRMDLGFGAEGKTLSVTAREFF